MGRAHYRQGKPRCKQEYDEKGENVVVYHVESRKETWQVLLMDLTVVALLINLTHFLFNCSEIVEAVFVLGDCISLSRRLVHGPKSSLSSLHLHTQGDCSLFSTTLECMSKISPRDLSLQTMHQRSLTLVPYLGCL